MTQINGILTCSDRDFFRLEDVEELTGLKKDAAYKFIRQVKSISDVFGISGMFHRVDYIKFLQHQLDNDVHNEFIPSLD